MAETIIGLDLGSTGVKAVHLRRGLMGLEWVKAVRRDWPHPLGPFDFNPPDSQAAVLRDLWAEMAVGQARVVVSVPMHLCSVRTITLPFTDERKLAQVVPFEVEAQLPYSLEEVVVDHHRLHTENGSSRLLVAALPKEILRRHLNLLSKIGIEPPLVELDALALYSLAHHGLQTLPPEIVMVEIGATKTVVLVMSQGEVRSARTILHGSQHWTQALAEAHSISLEEAEERKQRVGLSALGGEEGTSRPLSIALEAWVEELVKTLHVAQLESVSSGQPARQDLAGGPVVSSVSEGSGGSVVLCGGGAKLKELETFVATVLKRDIKTLIPPLVREKGLPWDIAWSQALGLALKGGGAKQASRLNFRKGEFAYTGEVVKSRRRTQMVFAGLLSLLLLAGADLTLKYRLQASHYRALREELRQMFTEMFPEVKNIVDEVQQTRTAIAELKKSAALFGSGEPSALGVLGELTARISKEIKIEVQELVIEPERVRLEAETDSFDSVDRIKAAVAQSALFSEVSVSDAKITVGQTTSGGSSGGKVRFRLTLQLASSPLSATGGGSGGRSETRP